MCLLQRWVFVCVNRSGRLPQLTGECTADRNGHNPSATLFTRVSRSAIVCRCLCTATSAYVSVDDITIIIIPPQPVPLTTVVTILGPLCE